MKKFILLVTFIFFLFNNITVNALYYYSPYYWESIESFISSPSYTDLLSIKDEATLYCETVYLEATRRREYSEIENAICSDIFEIKRQQELDYITYMYRNRGIY